MRASLSGRLTIRAALSLGFGLTLGLWLWAGYDFVQQMARVQQEAATVNLRYMQAQELLADVRPQVLIVAVNARTALLDTDPGKREGYRQRVRATLQSVRDTLRQYVPVLHSGIERERVERLRLEIEGFGQVVLDALAGDEAVTPAQASTLLARIAPRRELVIGVTDEVQAINRAAFVQEQAIIADAYRDMQRRVWERLGLSLLASLGIATIAGLYAGRLEARLRRQLEKDAQSARDLQRLSAKLVDAQEQERRTIARELHDELGQALETIKVELTLARNTLRHDGRGDLLNDAQAIAQSALTTVRDLSHLLHPAVLDDLGLVAATDVYVQAFAKRHAGIRTRFVHEGPARRIGSETEIAGYRIVQEALTNVARHARAGACTVTLRLTDASLSIVVDDDGVGFDPSASSGRRAGADEGLGLIGIRERVSQLGGTFRVESGHGTGTRVSVELPAPSREAGTPLGAHDAAGERLSPGMVGG